MSGENIAAHYNVHTAIDVMFLEGFPNESNVRGVIFRNQD
jgi:hypothetical protein